MIGIPLRDLAAMSLGEVNDAIAAFNAAHADDDGPVLTDAEEDELARLMGLA